MVIDLLNHRVAREVTEHDYERFTEGDCHILAEVMSEMTGKPMYAFGYRDRRSGKFQADLHVFIKPKRDCYFDIYGPRSRGDFMEQWDPMRHYEGKIIKVTRERMDRDDWDRKAQFPGSLRRAYEVAALLIKTNPEVFA